MLFNSYIFVLLFLPICLLGYFCLNRLEKYNTALLFLLGMSLWFYGYFNPKYLFVILISIIVNYGFYYLISLPLHLPSGKEHLNSKIASPAFRKFILLAALFFNIGALLYFKYMDFFISTINHIFHTNHALLHIVLPLGISFFTFQQISFIIDAYRGEVPKYNFLHYACFVSYFPQLIAGPIVTHDELVPQLMDRHKKKINWDNLAAGIYLFTFGLSKKVLLADTFGNAANIGFSDTSALNTTNALITMLSYTIQIYFDFSGYCDMAIGIGKMMNIDLPLNFNSPYKALTINEFWDRWHMTLTRFFTQYVYIPLGGNRKGVFRTYLNMLIVFLISGFWHGAGWNFIFWGGIHGLFCIVTRQFKSFFNRLHPALNWIITFGFVNIAWVFFRASSFQDALRLIDKILQFDFGPVDSSIIECFRLPEIVILLNKLPIESRYPCFLLVIAFAIAFLLLLGCRNAYEKMTTYRPTVYRIFTTALLMGWCIFSFAGVSTFLYFNF